MDEREKNLREEYIHLQKELEDPSVFNRSDYPAMAKRQGELAQVLSLFEDRQRFIEELQETKTLGDQSDPELTQLANEEAKLLQSKIDEVNTALEEALIPKDPNDERDCVMEIRAAAGGDEASLFAGDLYRMYARWCEKNNYKLELLGQSPSEGGGFKEIIFMVRGPQAYKNLKFEAGVHRVQRVPKTESSGRIHTSTVTVAVLPEAEETDVKIDPSDLKIDVFRSSGPGGQSVNTTDSAVRITHLPTGLTVSMQDEKSQIKNREKAMKVLRSRLLSLKIEEEQKQMSQERRALIGSGDRSEKIRTYNFPQDRITDHRVNYSRSNLPGALDGDFNDITQKLHDRELELKKS